VIRREGGREGGRVKGRMVWWLVECRCFWSYLRFLLLLLQPCHRSSASPFPSPSYSEGVICLQHRQGFPPLPIAAATAATATTTTAAPAAAAAAAHELALDAFPVHE